jgi:hypothetical protein
MLAALAVPLCASACVLLWRAREHYNVPERRGFSALVQRGVGTAAVILFADAYLLTGVWGAWTR